MSDYDSKSPTSVDKVSRARIDVGHPLDEPDAGSPEWVERHKYDARTVNNVKFGCEIHAILPSRGPERCTYAKRCDWAKDPKYGWLCRPGWPCPQEVSYFKYMVRGLRREFKKARRWLGDLVFEQTVRDFVLFDLRCSRCMARSAMEGLTRTVKRWRPDGNYEFAILHNLDDRYYVAASKGKDHALKLLSTDPDPEPPSKPLDHWEHLYDIQRRIAMIEHAEQVKKAMDRKEENLAGTSPAGNP